MSVTSHDRDAKPRVDGVGRFVEDQMEDVLSAAIVRTPVRVRVADNPVDILRFAAEVCHNGPAALATLVEIRGGAARGLGSHVAIAADGRYCGYVSGGCIEAALAAEALRAMAEGVDRMVRFGAGSPYFDIVLPCGGGVTIAIHVLRTTAALDAAIARFEAREPSGLRYSAQEATLVTVPQPTRPQWQGSDFLTAYHPLTRVIISGHTVEADAVALLASAANYEAIVRDADASPDEVMRAIDPYTAVVLLHHDLDAEETLLDAALRSPAFYIGALGSTRTHRRRTERLLERGHDRASVERIKAPIGMFGPARDATSLALSVLADVAATRLATGL